MLKSYVSKVQELEGELQRLKGSLSSKPNEYVDYDGLHDSGLQTKDSYYAEQDIKTAGLSGERLLLCGNLSKRFPFSFYYLSLGITSFI